MSVLKSVIRPVSGGDGPFYVATEKDGVVTNVTLTVANIAAALDQAKSDQAAVLGALTVQIVVINTTAT